MFRGYEKYRYFRPIARFISVTIHDNMNVIIVDDEYDHVMTRIQSNVSAVSDSDVATLAIGSVDPSLYMYAHTRSSCVSLSLARQPGASTPYKRWSKCTMEKVGGERFAET